MKKRVLVVSDLHLGGAPATEGKVGFQMCPPAGQQRLANFFDWAAAQSVGEGAATLHLVLNGDIVDFLAEPDSDGVFKALTTDQELACVKLERVFETTDVVWQALRRYVATGSKLILLLGNHDVELTLPSVRRKLLDKLGAGNVDFMYDNEALTFGPVLIEHGNRYDSWNAVFHNQLRELRSALSRRVPKPELPQVPLQPGSDLVVQVMNKIKHEYAFVDLLKPERQGVLPLLGFLKPSLWLKAQAGLRALVRSTLDARRPSGDPLNRDQVSGDDGYEGDGLFDQARLASAENPDQVSGDDQPSFAQRWRAATTDALKGVQLKALQAALKALVDTHKLTFDIEHEAEEYLKAARARLDAGFELVVFGHTHLAKDIDLKTDLAPGARRQYLNTGTWVDLMRVPDAIFSNTPESSTRLREFADALASNEIDAWRMRAPTYADIQLDGDVLLTAGVFFFDSAVAQPALSTSGLLERVARK